MHCLKISAQEMNICVSVHMHILAEAAIISHRSDLCLVFHFTCNLNINGNKCIIILSIILCFYAIMLMLEC